MEIANHTNQLKKRKKNPTPEGQFQFDLGTCSKNNDLSGALSLYETAVSQNIRLNHNHFNTLLYLCSNSLPDLSSSEAQHSSKDSAIEKGFCIFNRMLANNINPTEATITAVARLAAAKRDGDLAFEFVKTMGKYSILPRLRSYDPALFAFCHNLEAEKAYSVEEHMVSLGIHPEESELAALLKVSSETGREEKVYSYLQKLRNCVRCTSVSTSEIIERWFCSNLASEVGSSDWDENQVKDAILKNGGGWHGQGWLGKGKWVVTRSNVSSEGCCCTCGQRLVCVDIDRIETEKFAEMIASLAMEREVKSSFREFQEWLDKNAEYEAIVDGANIGLYQQNFADGGFSVSQLDSVVKELYDRSQKKWPLVILHNKRFRSLTASHSNRKILDEWKAQGALYTTPNGSNDDWYWLYAAIKLKCLLVTNDEMRDHIFEFLGSSFFLKWKERHQVRYTFLKCNLRLQMPPSYSLVIQESEKGSWHVPIEGGFSDEASRTWFCITRP
ncbi:Ribonuclease Zc3h12a-like [Macleaya cordata]|uniref:ribonuclease P n=1 Tax=Macleaya cordata TaxID=56857 RepID=A0A200PZE3_MACCD|nr:Ribonuclease Zc3h12a-like [Macleaya cordata]